MTMVMRQVAVTVYRLESWTEELSVEFGSQSVEGG